MNDQPDQQEAQDGKSEVEGKDANPEPTSHAASRREASKAEAERLNKAEHDVADAIEKAISRPVSLEEEAMLEAAELEEIED